MHDEATHQTEHSTRRDTDPTTNARHETALLSSYLRQAREEANYTIDDAAHDSGIEQERLARFEIGVASPTASELDTLCSLYECDVDSLPTADDFLPRLPSRAHVDGDLLILGPMVVPLGDDMSNREILDGAAAAIRKMRRLTTDAPVHLRKSEIPLIASVLDLSSESIALDVAKALRVSAVDSLALVDAFRAAASEGRVLVAARR